MSLNIDELVSKLLEAKKKKSSSSTDSAKKPDNSNLEQAEKEFAEYVAKINKAVEDLYMSPSERDSDIARRRAAITRKYNLPADTKFAADELPSSTQSGVKKTSGGSVDDTEAEYDDETPLYSVDDEGEATDEPSVSSNDTDETEDEPEVKPKQRRRQRNQSDSDEEPSLEAAKKAYAKQKEMLDKGVAKGTITPEERDVGLRDFKRATLRKNNLPNDTELEVPSDTTPPTDATAAGNSAEAPTDAKPADAEFDQKEKNRLQTLAGIKSDEVPPKEPETTNAPASAANTEEPQPSQVTTMADKPTTRTGRRAPAAKKAAKKPAAKKAAKKPAAKKAAKKTGTGKPRGTPPRPGVVVGAPPPAPPAGQRTAADINLPTNAGSEKDVTPGAKDASGLGNYTNTFSGKPPAPSGGFSAGTTSTGVTGGGAPVKFTPKATATGGTPSKELSADEKERLAKAGFRGQELGTSAPPAAPVAAPEKPVQPWSKQGQEMRAQQKAAQAADRAIRMAAMSPEERKAEKEKEQAATQRDKDASMRRLGFRPEPRGVGDRLRSAWKAFTAKPGDTVGIDKGYRSVFAEVQRLMEQLNMVEHILATESVQEGLVGGQTKLDMNKDGKLTAADFAMLRKLRKEIRSALVEQMIREELYNHNTTLAELNINQRAALAETIKKRSTKMWEQLSEMHIQEVEDDDDDYDADAEQARQEREDLDDLTGHDSEFDDAKSDAYDRWSREYENVSYTLEEWMGMLEEAEVIKPTDALQAAIKKYRQSLGPQGKTDPNRHAQVMPAVNKPKTSEAYTLEEWIGMLEEAGYDTNDMDEGKLSRLAAGLGLAGAAMMGGARDAGAQQATPTKAPTDSVQTATSRDMGLALNKAGFELDRRKISRQGARQDVVQNPDGTFTATIDARKRPATQAGGTPQMEERYSLEEWMGMLEEAGVNLNELSQDFLKRYINKAARSAAANAHFAGRLDADPNIPNGDNQKVKAAKRLRGIQRATEKLPESYTLEEWMGMMEEAGYDVSEYSLWRPKESGAKSTGVMKDPKKPKTPPAEPTKPKKKLDELSPETLKSYVKASKADMQKNLAKSTEKTLHVPGRARAEKRHQGQIAAFKKLGGDQDVAEAINENTVARLQQLAGINPTE